MRMFGAKTVFSPTTVQPLAGFSSPIELDGEQSDYFKDPFAGQHFQLIRRTPRKAFPRSRGAESCEDVESTRSRIAPTAGPISEVFHSESLFI